MEAMEEVAALAGCHLSWVPPVPHRLAAGGPVGVGGEDADDLGAGMDGPKSAAETRRKGGIRWLEHERIA